MKIYLSKNILKSLEHNAIATYVALRRLMDNVHDNYFITINMLCYLLFGYNPPYPERFIDNIKNGLNTLESKELITISKISRNELVVNLSSLRFDTSKEYFIIVDESEVNKIMSVKNDRAMLLTYFINVIGTLTKNKKGESNHDDGIGYCSIDFLAKECKVSERSAVEYNTILEKLQLLYIYRSNCVLVMDNQFSGVTNTYSRYADKDKCIRVGQQHSSDIKYKNTKPIKTDGNRTKSYSMKFNRIKQGHEYSYEETKEIYFEMIALNKRNKDRWKSDDYTKDLSIFAKYDFYKSDESSEDDTWGEDDPMDTDSDYTMDKYTIDEILEMPTQDEIKAKPVQKKSSLIDDYVKETSDVNSEANLVNKFLGNYSILYKDYIRKIAENELDTSIFFNMYCNHAGYPEYLKFKKSELAIDELM